MSKLLSVLSGQIKDDFLYVVDIDSWDYMRVNLKTGDYDVLADLLPQGRGRLAWIVSFHDYKGATFFVQRNSKNIICAENGEVRNYGDFTIGQNGDCINGGSVIYDRIMYIFPYLCDGSISRFDLDKRQFLEDVPFFDLLKLEDDYREKRNIMCDYIYEGNKVYFCVDDAPYVFELCIPDMKCSAVVTSETEPLSHICKDGRIVFGVWKNGMGYSEIDVESRISKHHSLESGVECAYVNRINEKVIALSFARQKAYIYDKKNTNVSTIDFSDISKNVKSVRNSRKNVVYSKCIRNKNSLYVLPFSSNGIIKLDIENEEAELIPCALDRFYFEGKDGDVYREMSDATLDDFLERFLLREEAD